MSASGAKKRVWDIVSHPNPLGPQWRVYEGGHSAFPILRKNHVLKRLIIPQGSETYLPAVADDAMQQVPDRPK